MENYVIAVRHVMAGMQSHASSIAQAVDSYHQVESSITDAEL
jgi:hypothetical protein